jgi:tetratricopeptide (TPR) repeat protein
VPSPTFAEMVSRLVEEFGLSVGAVRQGDEGLRLVTVDGFLYEFIENPSAWPREAAETILHETPHGARHLVVFSPLPLSPSTSTSLTKAGATVIEGPRFAELARSLGLGSFVGESPPAPVVSDRAPRLPSAELLDTILSRARSWNERGVPALALRFYRHAVELKPEFLPARNGSAGALLGLGLVPEARRGFEEVLRFDPENLEARLGLASVKSAEGDIDAELADYERLLLEDPDRTVVRASLVAALLEYRRWDHARREIHEMLRRVPDDAQLRFLSGIALTRMGDKGAGEVERSAARRLGLPFERERVLCEQFGLPAPKPPPTAPEPRAAPKRSAPARRPRTASRRKKAPNRKATPRRSTRPTPRRVRKGQ